MKFFKECNSIEELKKEYRKLCWKYHPDNGGTNELMAEVNKQYDDIFNQLKEVKNQQAKDDSTGRTRCMHETSEEFRKILFQIINLEGIEVELCGNWIWVSGNTKEYKNLFHKLELRWAPKKKMWYWRNEKDAVFSKGIPMNQIRRKYGSDKIKEQELLCQKG